MQAVKKSAIPQALALAICAGSLLLSGCQSANQSQTQPPARLPSPTQSQSQTQGTTASATGQSQAQNQGASPGNPGSSGSRITAGGATVVSEETARHLDVKTEIIKERELILPLYLTGHVEPDTGGEVDVSARISGRLVKIEVKPGDKVAKGDLLAMIDSREVAELEGEMLEAKSKLDIAMAHAERERQVYEEQIARPKALLDEKTRAAHARVKLDLAQSEFRRVEDLYKEKIAAAKDFVAAKATVAEAKLEMEQSQISLLREQHLYDNRVLMKKDYQLAMAEVIREKQHLKTIVKRLEFIGADAKLTAEVLKSGDMNGLARIVAPVEGVVNRYEFAAGEMVHPDHSIFKLTDLRFVQVLAALPEADLQRVKIGDHVKIKVSSYPNTSFAGTICLIAQHVHLQTRSLPIRARLANPGLKLKPNMFAEIDVDSTSGRGIACPKIAVHERAGHKIVFVKRPDGFEERVVKLETSDSSYGEVLEGLQVGDEVATEGSRALLDKRETR